MKREFIFSWNCQRGIARGAIPRPWVGGEISRPDQVTQTIQQERDITNKNMVP